MQVRLLEENDIPIVQGWYDDYEGWIAPALDSLPQDGLGGFVVHKGEQLIVAGYLYLTNSKTAILEWVIGDKKYRDEDRGDAILLLIQTLSLYAKDLGYNYVYTFSQHDKLMNKFIEVGFHKNPTVSYELLLKL